MPENPNNIKKMQDLIAMGIQLINTPLVCPTCKVTTREAMITKEGHWLCSKCHKKSI